MNYVEQYLTEIKRGKCVVNKRVRAVYEKLVDDIKNPKDGFIFDEKKADRAVTFIEKFCRNSKGEWAGKPVQLLLFQKAYISALFGFVSAETGLRKYKESFFYVARKNGKTTLLAGIALYCLIADGEAGAECYSVATKKDQAKLLYDELCNMVRQSPELARVCKKRKSDLYFSLGMSKAQPLGKNSDTLDGLNASLVVMDELHAIRGRNLYEVMRQSQSARRQPLLIMITTAGTVRESIFDDMFKYACGVADGIIKDDTFLPILYALDSKDEWLKPMAWEKANPALGQIKKLEDLIAKVERAKNSPRDLAGILCKDFNIITSTSTAWLSFEDINNDETFSLEDFRGAYAIGGADLSITTDLTCATLLMMNKEEKRFVTQMYFLPADNFDQRVNEEKIPYDKWREAGLLRLTPGNTIDYSYVTAWFIEMLEKYEITPAWIYYDSYSARYWVEEMTQSGFNMVRCIQGAKTLSLPMQMLGADLKAKKINYGGNPLLKWCLTNVGIQEDRNGNIVPVKATSAKYRIDGAAALLDSYVGLYEHYNEFLNAID